MSSFAQFPELLPRENASDPNELNIHLNLNPIEEDIFYVTG